MNTLRKFTFALMAVAGLSLAAADVADAAVVRVCGPSRAGTAVGPGRWVAPTSTNAYSTDSNGCVVIAATDLGDARNAGFIVDPRVGFVLGLSSTSVDSSFTLPSAGRLDSIVLQETSGAAVTGGIFIGTTSGGRDITEIALGASQITQVPDSSMLKRVFTTTGGQQIFIKGDNKANNSSVNVTIQYSYF